MKKIFCVILAGVMFAACGSGSSNNNNSDSVTRVGPADTTVHTMDSSGMMMQDTTHKDSVIK